MAERRDRAVVVGAGPNGLAAAVVLARAGRAVTVLEGADTAGGGCRSAELTLPGFVHDTCATVHALALASPFLRTLPLAAHGFEPVHPGAPLAHPLDDGTAAMLERSVDRTAVGLGHDEAAYRRTFAPLARDARALFAQVLGPLRQPRHPLALARFGVDAVRPAEAFARSRFRGERARALFAGCAAHAMLPLDAPVSAAFGLVLAMAGHAVGWPVARGGSQRLADALAAHLRALGGTIETGHAAASLDDLPVGRAPVLLDVTPRALLQLAGPRLAGRSRRRLEGFRHGPGVFKLDWALAGPVPWRDPAVGGAATVHLGGTLGEIARAEAEVAGGRHPDRPYVLAVQPCAADPSRAPDGKHVLWAYCHVPNGSTADRTAAVEDQIERFAPGFRDLILARAAHDTAALERHNPNLVGGDIAGGYSGLSQFMRRPSLSPRPWRTPLPGVYLCSASTPPGAAVHGMGGYHAARVALADLTSGRA